MMKKQNKGFTLVETLVAITILMVSITGPYYSVYKALQTTYIARDKLIATALAQEGIEFVRNKRDSNYLQNVANPGSPVNWLNGLSACKGASATCTVDVTNGATAACAGTCPVLNIVGNVYTQQTVGATATRFTRTVNVTEVTTDVEATVTVTLTWVNAHMTNSIVVTEHLYNWL